MTVLVAGVGNIFCTDDGFGSAVARRLLSEGGLPAGVEVVDAGIRGMHLAYQLLDGYTALLLVDITRRDARPGTLHLLEHDLDAGREEAAARRFDPHGMEPDAVLDQIRALARGVGAGGELARVLVLGCEPADIGPGMALTEPVAEAVGEAVSAVHRVVARLRDDVPFTPAGAEPATETAGGPR